ncbi:MAG: two-component system response regulator OmpR [Burkholderiales bacterium]|nr:two-component system response regulator OmpR [Pseudomonadota bacterium]MCC7067001.1 two-component system response regulator OmpR [Burkholderiales bacterium]MCZ2136281.1 two-component system response regulator OmpR [Burkholderiales bacterium]
MSNAAHILIVDDDQRLRDLLQRYLAEQGFRVTGLADARELSRRLDRDPPHLIVLDWMMPHEDGIAVCRRLRASGDHTPVIMLTAKGEEDERIDGLEAGADDYLPKPFNPRELVARIQAVLRRAAVAAPGAPEPSDGPVRFSDCAVDFTTRTVTRAGVVQELTTSEFAMLKVFLTHPHEALSRERLSLLARGKEHEVFDRAVDVQVSRLRKLVEPDPAKPRYIQTVWGRGYVFVPD